LKRATFELYHFSNLIKTSLIYVEERPESKTYYIRVEGDNIEEILEKIYLPERLKQNLRDDIVNIVKGYNMMVSRLEYTEASRELCKRYFRDMFNRFCVIYGQFYQFKEGEIID
jgi:hypothetical protein